MIINVLIYVIFFESELSDFWIGFEGTGERRGGGDGNC
jgi:hypothetical protein